TQCFERVRCLFIAYIERGPLPALRDVAKAPIGPRLSLAISLDVYGMTWCELVDSAVNGMRRRHVIDPQIGHERIVLDHGPAARQCHTPFVERGADHGG